MKAFWVCFVPIFFAVNAFGILPMFLDFTEDMESENEHGLMMIFAAILLNILIAGMIFFFARGFHRFLGKGGAKTISKIASLLLTAIGVMMVRKGIASFITLGISG